MDINILMQEIKDDFTKYYTKSNNFGLELDKFLGLNYKEQFKQDVIKYLQKLKDDGHFVEIPRVSNFRGEGDTMTYDIEATRDMFASDEDWERFCTQQWNEVSNASN